MAKHNLHLLPSLLFFSTIVASPSIASGTSLTPPLATPPAAAPPMAAPPPANSSTPTAYEMLEQYNLTRGILPEGVTGYVLRPNGSFEVYLPGDCNIHAANMQIKYSSRIAGREHPGPVDPWFGGSEGGHDVAMDWHHTGHSHRRPAQLLCWPDIEVIPHW
ncbi:hypothetical protein PVAP13_8NG191800 [Panicum virgatum]|uniref:Uncharacterized protein n=1 Tax=Panicum virgatum TaxID=38727 RepID=A0A8T0P7F2_PANVG|nr:hypothetical protein PVAP13_8NG191800 [Panicum virgatum]